MLLLVTPAVVRRHTVKDAASSRRGGIDLHPSAEHELREGRAPSSPNLSAPPPSAYRPAAVGSVALRWPEQRGSRLPAVDGLLTHGHSIGLSLLGRPHGGDAMGSVTDRRGLPAPAWRVVPRRVAHAARAVVDVEGKAVSVARPFVELRTAPPREWTVVAAVGGQGPANLQSGYVVCPNCRHRVVLPFARVPKLQCPRCNQLFPIGWDEAYLPPT